MKTQIFFSDTRRQKRSLTEINESLGDEIAGKMKTLGYEIGFLQICTSIIFLDSASIRHSGLKAYRRSRIDETKR